jgi:hypothetical protein
MVSKIILDAMFTKIISVAKFSKIILDAMFTKIILVDMVSKIISVCYDH